MASTEETQTRPDSRKQSDMPSTSGTVEQTVVPAAQRIVEHVPERTDVQGWFLWITICLVVLTICFITFTGSALFLAIATPIGLFLSPILVPLGVTLFFGTAGVLSSASFGLAALSAIVWVYKYCRGEEPVYSDRIAGATSRIAGYIPHQVEDLRLRILVATST